MQTFAGFGVRYNSLLLLEALATRLQYPDCMRYRVVEWLRFCASEVLKRTMSGAYRHHRLCLPVWFTSYSAMVIDGTGALIVYQLLF
jgi:hypothetical protein